MSAGQYDLIEKTIFLIGGIILNNSSFKQAMTFRFLSLDVLHFVSRFCRSDVVKLYSLFCYLIVGIERIVLTHNLLLISDNRISMDYYFVYQNCYKLLMTPST